METAYRVTHHTVGSIIPRLIYLLEIPSLGVVEAWRNVNIVEQLECGAYRDAMLHTIAPVGQEIRFKYQILLCRDAVVELSAI